MLAWTFSELLTSLIVEVLNATIDALSTGESNDNIWFSESGNNSALLMRAIVRC